MKFSAYFIAAVLTLALSGCVSQTKPTSTAINISGQNQISQALLSQHNSWQGTPYKLGG